MTDELKPVRCGCGGDAKVSWDIINGWYMTGVHCENCGISTQPVYNRDDKDKAIADAVTAWNRAMGNRDELSRNEWTAKVEKVDTNSPHSQVYKCCKCGQYTHRTAWSRDVHYCPSCGAELEWE